MMLDPADVLASLPNPLGIITAQGEVEYANQAFTDLFRRTGGHAAEPAAQVTAPPLLVARLQKSCRRLRSVGLRAHFRWTPSESADDTFAVHVTRARDDHFVVVFERISEMVEIEEIYSRTRSYLDGVLNSLNLGVIGLDARFNITFINKDQATLFASIGGEQSLFEAIGAAVASTYPLLTAAQWTDTYERVVHGREVVTHARIGFPREQAEATYALSVVPLVDEQRRVIGGVAVTEDITRLVQLENELIEKARLGLVGQMAIALNHEINNPLTAILGLAQIAQRSDDLADTTRRAMAKIETQALRIADVTRRLRQLESIRLTEYLKDGPLMIDLTAGSGQMPAGAQPTVAHEREAHAGKATPVRGD